MTTTMNVTSHPVLNSVVHHPFNSASRDVGCSEFTEVEFLQALKPYLSTLNDALGTSQLDVQRLWMNMMVGEVIAVEFDAGTLLFHVQGRAFGHYIDMRFACNKDQWTITAVTSVHTRPFWRSRLITTLVACVVGMLATGFIGYTMAAQRSPISKQTVQSWATLHGYTLVPSAGSSPSSAVAMGNQSASAPSVSNSSASGASGASGSSATGSTATGSSAKGSATGNAKMSTKKPSIDKSSSAKAAAASKPSSPQIYHFTLTSGMPLHDISVFLQQHHLVGNAFAFDQVLHKTGVEKYVWPGTYTFHSNMTQSQILQELKSKP